MVIARASLAGIWLSASMWHAHDVSGGWVYIMASGPSGTLYVGVTADLARRAWEHREGEGSDFCRKHGLTMLVHVEEFPTIGEAIAREKAIKRWKRAWKLNLIGKGNPAWRDLWDDLNM